MDGNLTTSKALADYPPSTSLYAFTSHIYFAFYLDQDSYRSPRLEDSSRSDLFGGHSQEDKSR